MKHFINFLAVIFLLVFAETILCQDWEDYNMTSEVINYPLFTKVFPEVELILQTSEITMPPSKRLIAQYEGQDYLMPGSINVLFELVKQNSKASDEEKIEVFLRLYYWLRDKNLEFSEFRSTEYNQINKWTNNKLQLKIDNVLHEVYIYIKDDQIMRIEIFLQNERIERIIPKVVSIEQATITISGVTPETYGTTDHYYIVVSENGTATNNTITFNVSGLAPNQQNVQLQIVPHYGYGGTLFLDQLLTVDGSGNANYIWTPLNNNQTGICDVQVVENGGPPIPLDDSWIIPEHTLTGTFNAGYNYTIYFTNQFFTLHPSGITHADDFAELTSSALEESWTKQVIDWSLASGCDNDQPEDYNDIYELFINDNNLSYHGSTTNEAFGGSERRIGIRYNSYLTQSLYSSEEMRIKVAVAHEFYHGIEWSHNNGWGSGHWMLEGQARFIPTVQYENEEFFIETTQHFYPTDANNFLISTIESNEGLSTISYDYCIFWRFLYENYSIGTVAQKLNIIRQTCRGNTNSNIGSIENFMDSKLNGIYNFFDDAIKDFTERLYLNDAIFNKWNPVPSDAFYSKPNICKTHTFNGTSYIETDQIANPFSMDYWEINFDNSYNNLMIQFNADPDDDNNKSEFYVKALILNGDNIVSSHEIGIVDDLGFLSFGISSSAEKLILMMCRLDGNSGSENDYRVTLYPIDNSITMISPIEGNPIICKMTPHWWGLWHTVEPMDIVLSVLDGNGNFVSGLNSTNFEVYINNTPVAAINSVTQGSNQYTININPNVEEEGLYDLRVNYTASNSIVLCTKTVVGGILYTNKPVIEKGLKWLRTQQNITSGYWQGYSADLVGTTALTLQAFLAQGYSPQADQSVQKGVEYLLSQVKANGGIYNWNEEAGYQCGMAITALRSAAKYNPPNLTQINTAISNAQQYFITYQSSVGGWRYIPHSNPNDYDLSVTQWVILAMDGVDNPTMWNKVRTFLHSYVRNTTSGGYGYQNSSATNTMTCAGIWGEIIADGPQSNVDAAFSWLINQYGSANGIINSSDYSDRTYYYTYGLAKACALSGRTLLAGENWYQILNNKLANSLSSNHWYNNYSSWENEVFSTSLAILSLEVGTVPPDSRFKIRLSNNSPIANLGDLPSNVLLNVYDGLGNFAGKNESGVWITDIPNSQWNSTSGYYELEVELSIAESFTIEIFNEDTAAVGYIIDFEAYQGTNPDPVSTQSFNGNIATGQAVGTTATVNSIGGLTIYSPPPASLPVMALNPVNFELRPIKNDSTYTFSFNINESSGYQKLSNIDIFASNLVDQFGNTIPASYYAFTPSHLDSISAGSSATIQVALSIPGSSIIDLSDFGEFHGLITLQATNQTKSIQMIVGPYHFTDMTTVALTGVGTGSVDWGDYDNDNDLDIIFSGFLGGIGDPNVTKIYRNDGNNNFIEQTSISLTGVADGEVVWGDYDNDGDLDILLTGYTGSVRVSKIYRNEGSNTFTEQTSINLIGVNGSSANWVDYNNDGRLDILITGYNGTSTISKIYHNEGNNSFSEQTLISLIGVTSGSTAWGDYDNDADLDLLLTGFTGSTRIAKIYRNDGESQFTDQTSIMLSGIQNSSTSWGDYDCDGLLDILMSGTSVTGQPISKVYRNLGNGFAEQTSIVLPGVYWGSSVWGDYDNDGDLDILLSGTISPPLTGIAKIYKNFGNNTFSELTDVLFTSVSESAAKWGDYDNDGDLDILVTGYKLPAVTKLYRNNNAILNSVPTSPTGLVISTSIDTVTFSWNRSNDNQTPQNGLTYNLVISTTPGVGEIVSPMSDFSTGFRRVVQLGNTNQNISWRINSLEPGTYYWSVQSIDNAFAGSGFAPEQSFIISPYRFQLDVSVNNKWNMVSIPGLQPSDQNVNTWWIYRDPGAEVFKYVAGIGYQPVTTVTPGFGYWMKHSGVRTYNTGEEWPAEGIKKVPHAPLNGLQGWNLIGGYELNVATSGITTNPPGLQTGEVYKFTTGYYPAASLEPGYGYWIKLTAPGQIIIPETLAKGEAVEYFPKDWGKIILTDAAGASYTLYAIKGKVDLNQYELPPAPPVGMYDFRFSSGRIAEDIGEGMKTIEMSGVVYPLTVRVEGMDIRLMDESEKIIDVNLKDGENLLINDVTINKLKISGELMPTVYALEQNFPNPFNPSTKIRFSIPTEVQVELSVFNILGERVTELKNEIMKPGYYDVEFNASDLASGVYLYRIKAGDFIESKKMILIK